MVGHDVDGRIAPPVELTNETRQPVDLQVDVTDQRLGLAVADVVDLVVAEDDEQLAESCRSVGGGLDVRDVPAVGAERLQKGEPVVAHRHVLAVDLGCSALPLISTSHRRRREREQRGHADRRDRRQHRRGPARRRRRGRWRMSLDGEGAVVAKGVDDDDRPPALGFPQRVLRGGR